MALDPGGVYELRADPALEATLEVYAALVDHVGLYEPSALIDAAVSYMSAAKADTVIGGAASVDYQALVVPPTWPFRPAAWQPHSPRGDLIKAAAMLIAEVKRMDDAALGQTVKHTSN